ncbi:hypothetical protein MTBUT4_170018 [Magnetospirillum sp. UT-4]|nr:hypothetical protein MTBUT4_170018 [Magnetospirillum sp. UT-4]
MTVSLAQNDFVLIPLEIQGKHRIATIKAFCKYSEVVKHCALAVSEFGCIPLGFQQAECALFTTVQISDHHGKHDACVAPRKENGAPTDLYFVLQRRLWAKQARKHQTGRFAQFARQPCRDAATHGLRLYGCTHPFLKRNRAIRRENTIERGGFQIPPSLSISSDPLNKICNYAKYILSINEYHLLVPGNDDIAPHIKGMQSREKIFTISLVRPSVDRKPVTKGESDVFEVEDFCCPLAGEASQTILHRFNKCRGNGRSQCCRTVR